VARRERDDVPLGERSHLACVRDAIVIHIVPQRETIELVAAQGAVAIVVERAQRLIAVVPEQQERNVAEELQRRGDAACADKFPRGRVQPSPG